MNADMQIEIDGPHVELAVEVFSLLADATRVRLILALGDGELPVNALAEKVGNPLLRCRSIWPRCGWAAWSPPGRKAPRSTTG